jgi:phosphoribosyl 1,2-cyclic phosphodiesterase
MSFLVNYWGVRGSLPASPPPHIWNDHIEKLFKEFFERGYSSANDISRFIKSKGVPEVGGFGSHTTCVEVTDGQSQIIIDGGSGLRNLGTQMLSGPSGQGKAEIHIFMTHFHWDHLLGVPFFPAHFIKGNIINYYAVQPDLQDRIKIKFSKPFFPVPFESLPATLKFHTLVPRKAVKIGDFSVVPYQLDHPDPCWGYRVTKAGKVYSHCVDTEGTRVSREAMGEDLPLYQGVDLMYFDAQYTLPELAEKSNWGHSAAQIGLDIAIREKVKEVVFTHHDPGADTNQVLQLQAETQEYFDHIIGRSKANNVDLFQPKWCYAYEGLTVDVDKIP